MEERRGEGKERREGKVRRNKGQGRVEKNRVVKRMKNEERGVIKIGEYEFYRWK